MPNDTPDPACQIGTCTKPARPGRRLCSMHEARKTRHGDPLHVAYAMDVDATNWESFLGKRITRQNDGCWTWNAYRNPNGYGQVRFRGSNWYAHRVSYTLAVGPIPDGLTVDHICFKPSCVRPDHLRLLTLAENTARHEIKARTCKRGHALPSLEHVGECDRCIKIKNRFRHWRDRNGLVRGSVRPCPLCGAEGADVDMHWTEHMALGVTWVACSRCGTATEGRTTCEDCRQAMRKRA